MKLRILNAHASMCYPALLLGHHFVHDAMADSDILHWIKTLLPGRPYLLLSLYQPWLSSISR